ncbi:MAG: PEGA domain-containing protein [Nannocystaceae bacterium]
MALELAGDCDAPCRARGRGRARAMDVTATVTARDRDFELALLLDARDGRELAATTATCEVCVVAEVGDMLADRAAVLGAKLDALATAPPRLRFVSCPGGAMISIDGERVGAAPLERTLDAGRHRAKAVLEGHLPLELQFDAVAGTEEELTLTLSPVPPRARALRPAGAATLGIGVALAAVGVPLLVLHGRPFRGRCTGADVDVDGDCRFRYDTRTGGAMVTAHRRCRCDRDRRGVAGCRRKRGRPRRRAHARVGLGRAALGRSRWAHGILEGADARRCCPATAKLCAGVDALDDHACGGGGAAGAADAEVLVQQRIGADDTGLPCHGQLDPDAPIVVREPQLCENEALRRGLGSDVDHGPRPGPVRTPPGCRPRWCPGGCRNSKTSRPTPCRMQHPVPGRWCCARPGSRRNRPRRWARCC